MSTPVISDPAAMTAWSDAARARGETIVFVPTMGALHAGHLALLEEARRHGKRVVLSIFVNPKQFGPKEDFTKYPRDVVGDLAKAGEVGLDVAFIPEAAAMYPRGFQTLIEVRDVAKGLCGDRRPGHFVGVATVVCKLFNVVRPHVAVFGEKDFQQLAVVRRMVTDLDMGVKVLGFPTVREADGMAMSSRNAYLSAGDRKRAAGLYRGLIAARELHAQGERSAWVLVATARAHVERSADSVDYLEVRDAETLAPIERVDAPAVMLVAAFVGGTRLIDNLRL